MAVLLLDAKGFFYFLKEFLFERWFRCQNLQVTIIFPLGMTQCVIIGSSNYFE